MVDLRVLGGVDLHGPDGTELRSVLQQPKRLALLVWLAAAHPRGFHRRDSLLALFWPELDAAAARNALGQAVHFLRQQLGEGVVASRGRAELGVAPGGLRCDAAAFEEELDAGRSTAALELYRGDLLAGFHLSGVPEFERWSASATGCAPAPSRRRGGWPTSTPAAATRPAPRAGPARPWSWTRSTSAGCGGCWCCWTRRATAPAPCRRTRSSPAGCGASWRRSRRGRRARWRTGSARSGPVRRPAPPRPAPSPCSRSWT